MSDINEMLKATLDGIKSFTDIETIVGNVINTPSGVTVIPISKVTVGYAGCGIDYGQKKLTQAQNFGGGCGTGISITPIAFLTVGINADVNLIMLNDDKRGTDKLLSIIERSPEIIEKIRSTLS